MIRISVPVSSEFIIIPALSLKISFNLVLRFFKPMHLYSPSVHSLFSDSTILLSLSLSIPCPLSFTIIMALNPSKTTLISIVLTVDLYSRACLIEFSTKLCIDNLGISKSKAKSSNS